MKLKLTLLVATCVAISSLNPHPARSQELTKEQKLADIVREAEAIVLEQQAQEISAARLSTLTEEQRQELELLRIERELKNPPPPLPSTEIVKRIRTANTSSKSVSLTLSGESKNSSMTLARLSGGGEGGIDVPPFDTYGIAKLVNWNTDSVSGLYYPWEPESNSYSTNMGIRSYFALPVNCSSRAWAIATNHYDLNGDPRAHELRTVYKFDNSAGNGVFQVRLGSPTGTLLTNLPTAGLNVLTTNTLIVPRFVGTNLNLYYIVFRNGAGATPQGHLISVQWQAYSGPATNALTAKNIAPGVINLTWNTLNHQTNHWHLEYANNVFGPWASNTAPVSISNWQASVNFTNADPQRLYRLQYHWPGYH